MALSGKLLADFSDFETACKNAETKLVSFETGAEKVTSSLQRMETSLSGKKLIQDVTLAVQAVENIGGVSKLTEKQLQQLAGQATEAVAKMKAMGIDVPPGIARIAAEAREADTAHRGLGSTVKDLALGFAAMFTARAAFNFIKSTIDEASALKDLSQQTHISVEELQILAGGMSEFGVDADTLGKGLYKLSRGIAGGDDSVARGLHLMGMGLKDVEGLNGKELFLKIMGGLATLQGGLRDDTAAQLFGGKLGMAMAGASEGIEGAIATWQRMNHVTGTEAVDELDKFGEAITRANKSLASMATNLMGPVAEGFNVLFEAASNGASLWDLALGLLPKGLGAVGTGTEGLGNAIAALNLKTEAQIAGTTRANEAGRARVEVLTAEQQAVKFLAALEGDAAAALTVAQLNNLAHLKDIGALNAANAAGIGVNAAQFAKYTADQTVAQASLKAALQETEKTIKILADLQDAKWKQQLAMDVKILASTAALSASYLKLTNEAVLKEFEAQAKLNGAIEIQVTAMGRLDAAQKALQATKIAGFSIAAQEQVLMNQFGQDLMDEAIAEEKARFAAQGMNAEVAKTPQIAKAASGELRDLATIFNESAGVIIGAAQQVGQAVAMTNAQIMQMPRHMRPGESPFMTQSEWISATVTAQGLANFQGRAVGGPVSGGQTYLVGERGPELYTPGANGFITPNGGGGVTVQNTIYVNGTAADVARQVAAEITRSVLQGQKLASA